MMKIVALTALLGLGACSPETQAISGCACSASQPCTNGGVCDGCRCVPPCGSSSDCADPRKPNCDAGTGECFAPCTAAEDCPGDDPVCLVDTGICKNPGRCNSHADCDDFDFPNCQLDDDMAEAAHCLGRCSTDNPCPSDLYPNCVNGRCEAVCTRPGHCFGNLPNCDYDVGLCVGLCQTDDDCAFPSPVCDYITGICQRPCSEDHPCPASAPNCGDDGRCYDNCASLTSCPSAAAPNCDFDSGLCSTACDDDNPCSYADHPNCDTSTGACLGLCRTPGDCGAAEPNCNPADGLCYGPCTSNLDCVDPQFPNCDTQSGQCGPLCSENADCPEGTLPNCGADGLCVGACEDHADCTLTSLPNCQRDSEQPSQGFCLRPCTDPIGGCTSSVYSICDTITGSCEEPCQSAEDCPPNRNCDVPSGACLPPSCDNDGDCGNGFVCDENLCQAGCQRHSDCPSNERCGDNGRCEPRDCLDDGDCGAPMVCDTDGRADVSGGGFCVAACATELQCPPGFACDAGNCDAIDYGDVGQPCTSPSDCSNCRSGRGVQHEGAMLCSAYCCNQSHCPADYVCDVVNDGTCSGGGCSVDMCVPLPDDEEQGRRRVGELCDVDADCRSQACVQQTGVSAKQCVDTCCRDADCGATQACRHIGNGRTGCVNGAKATDLGTPGCEAAVNPDQRTSCDSGFCFLFYYGGTSDEACTEPADCPGEFINDYCAPLDPDEYNDCATDFCVEHCCSTSDCDGAEDGRSYYCSKFFYPNTPLDTNICMLNTAEGTGAAGSPCTSNGDCVSNFCSPTANVCRERCCTNEQCGAAAPNCGLETFELVTGSRRVNVCLP